MKRISWYFVQSFINIADLGGNCEGSYTSYSSLKQVKFKRREREEKKNKQPNHTTECQQLIETLSCTSHLRRFFSPVFYLGGLVQFFATVSLSLFNLKSQINVSLHEFVFLKAKVSMCIRLAGFLSPLLLTCFLPSNKPKRTLLKIL